MSAARAQAAILPEMTTAELEQRVGREIGVSDWREVRQHDIDRFAEVTDDDQFIHTDPARAAETPFGGTIAHGFLTLSLLSALGHDALPRVSGLRMGLNYGFDRLRFVSPVPSGRRIRGRFVLRGVERRSASDLLVRYGVTVEVEGSDRPAIVAEWLTMIVTA